MAAMSGEWLRRKVSHPWEGGQDRLTMYFATLDSATSKPSLSSSPWMRGAPHSGLSTLIRRINARRSASICGRPRRERDFQCQYRRKPARCQRTRVSGRMIVMVFRTDGNHRWNFRKEQPQLLLPCIAKRYHDLRSNHDSNSRTDKQCHSSDDVMQVA